MSKLSDYSKFDHLDEDDDSENEKEQSKKAQPLVQAPQQTPLPPQQQSATTAASNTTAAPTTSNNRTSNPTQRKDSKTGRYVFEYNGTPVYEWEQKLEEVTIFVKPPPFVNKGNQINCRITATHLQLGLVGASQLFLNEATFGLVDVDESTWSLEDDDDGKGKVICIYLCKAQKGILWDAALKGTTAVKLDAASQEQVRKDLLLERFQEENPGFDFRNADFNGSVPDARTFMGGVKYQ